MHWYGQKWSMLQSRRGKWKSLVHCVISRFILFQTEAAIVKNAAF